MPQFLRYCAVTSDGGEFLDPGTDNNGSPGMGLRVRFEITQMTMQSPNILKLMVTNPLPQTAQQFVKKEFAHIKIDAGYQDGHGVIFQGDIKFAIYGRESPTDTLLTVWAGDGEMAHNYATVNTTLPPGSTPQQHFDVAAQAMGAKGLSKGFIGVDLSQPVYSRAVTLVGMARTVLSNIAKTKQATVSYQNEKITMVPYGGSAPGSAFVLNSTTGLIGMPTQSIEGIFARCLINPQIKINTQVKINEGDIQSGATPITSTGQEQITQQFLSPKAADGLYTVYRIDASGDTRGNPWYQDLMCLATKEAFAFGAPPLPTGALFPGVAGAPAADVNQAKANVPWLGNN